MAKVADIIWTPGAGASARHRARQVAEASSWMAMPLATALSVRILVFVVTDLWAHITHPTLIGGVLSTWNRFDSNWYITVAQHGYYYSTVTGSAVNFFPLYPFLIWLTQPLGRFFDPRNSYLLAGMAISWVAFCAACVLLYRLALDRFGAATAQGAVLLLAVFPFSFYYGAAFSEAVYLMLVVLAFLCIERQWWWVAGIAALLAGAERPPGLIVAACVTLAYGLDWLRTRHPLRRDVLALALTPLGAVGYSVYCWIAFGTPFAYILSSRIGWHGGYLQTGALDLTWRILHHLTFNGIYTLYVLFFLLFLVLIAPIARVLGLPYALFTFASVVAPILDFPTIESVGRYMSVVFPAFLMIAYALRRWPRLQGVVAGVSFVTLIWCAALFIEGFGLA